MTLAQPAPLAHLELRPSSRRTRDCQESQGPKERRAILARLGTRDHRVILENWGLGDPLDHRVPGVKKVHRGRLEQLGTPAFLGLQAPLVPVAPQEVRAPLASEGRMASAERREPWEKKGAQGQLAPGVTPEPQGSPGHLEKEKMESRGFVDRLGYLGL